MCFAATFPSVNKGVQEKKDWDDWSKGRSEAGTTAGRDDCSKGRSEQGTIGARDDRSKGRSVAGTTLQRDDWGQGRLKSGTIIDRDDQLKGQMMKGNTDKKKQYKEGSTQRRNLILLPSVKAPEYCQKRALPDFFVLNTLSGKYKTCLARRKKIPYKLST